MNNKEYELKTKKFEELKAVLSEERDRRRSVERYKNLLDNLKNKDWSIDKITFQNEYRHTVKEYEECIDDLNLLNGSMKQHGIYKDVQEELRNLVIKFLEDYIKKLEE